MSPSSSRARLKAKQHLQFPTPKRIVKSEPNITRHEPAGYSGEDAERGGVDDERVGRQEYGESYQGDGGSAVKTEHEVFDVDDDGGEYDDGGDYGYEDIDRARGGGDQYEVKEEYNDEIYNEVEGGQEEFSGDQGERNSWDVKPSEWQQYPSGVGESSGMVSIDLDTLFHYLG